VFAGLELIRERMQQGAGFEEARAATRRQVVFTTHTPIEAGNEAHPLDRLLYMGANLDLTLEQMVSIGGAPFNMTAAALRLSRKANAVAALHGETARGMWADLDDAASIIAITNGVHLPTWVDPAILKATSRKALWAAHQKNKRKLIRLIRERTGAELSEDVLLVGFSRRAALYKRGDLIFRNLRRLAPLLRDGKLQIVWSGKSYPMDDGGRDLVARVARLAQRFPNQVVFLPNYDMTIGAALTRGADIWLNTPQRPMEASGTSGMKAAMNGAPNLSILDGWWPEACKHGINGWQIGDGTEFASSRKQDAHDLAALFETLENEVIPTYYSDRAGWCRIMRASITATKTRFSARRMLTQYYRDLYGGRS
jgi:starch phosphorylase